MILALYQVLENWPLKYDIVGRNVDLCANVHINSLCFFTVRKGTLLSKDLCRKNSWCDKKQILSRNNYFPCDRSYFNFPCNVCSQSWKEEVGFPGAFRATHTKKDWTMARCSRINLNKALPPLIMKCSVKEGVIMKVTMNPTGGISTWGKDSVFRLSAWFDHSFDSVNWSIKGQYIAFGTER